MIRFEDFKLNQFTPGKMGLTWKAIGDLNKYSILVERSGGPEGPFDILTPIPLVNTFGFIDTTFNRDSIYRNVYYRLSATNKNTNEVNYSAVINNIQDSMSYIGKYVAMEDKILLERFIGTKCLLFIRKTFGTRCTNCYDPTRGKAITENCEVCWNTTFVDGFFSPIKIHIHIDPRIKAVSKNEYGKNEKKDIESWMSCFPIISPGDFLVEVENDNQRFLIDNLSYVRDVLNLPIKQIPTLIRIDNSSILSRMPVDKAAPSIDDVNVYRRG